ncbi:putative exported protein [Xanthomonas citri pv. fuscans]|uniref:Putative exported protein n=1 Tax=Xanthomonas campestris pv. phaseoli TaxID=317013 RepID=A0A7Z7IZJ2_XANCH|nr:putative exported protein [Xanthomonas citri pv. fuscans]SOO23259.1 putative exported protein [Xanthomonas phaseoli pv. phaseoli]SOO26339.1 putative exported protein [Xanthomonas phaseoli pv. phaseoli]
MELSMRMLTAFLSFLLLLPSFSVVLAAKPRQPTAYPTEIQGVWNLGPQSCRLPVNPDSDSPIHIEKTRLHGYEHEETPVSIKLVSNAPHAWVVSATSDIAPDVRTDDLYILKGEHLVISDGESVKQYRRCK